MIFRGTARIWGGCGTCGVDGVAGVAGLGGIVKLDGVAIEVPAWEKVSTSE